jgi:thiamine pyrophosphokinase
MENAPQNIVIFANGEPVKLEIVKEYLPAKPIIIAADGGVNHLNDYNLKPKYILGDMDSAKPQERVRYPQAELIYKTDPNATDLQKTLRFALEQNPASITIFNALGKRADHSAGNLYILQNLGCNLPLTILDNYGGLTMLSEGRHRFSGKKGRTISFFSFKPVQNISLFGFCYHLENKNYADGFLGVSNVATENVCGISFEGGPLFMYEAFEERNPCEKDKR